MVRDVEAVRDVVVVVGGFGGRVVGLVGLVVGLVIFYSL